MKKIVKTINLLKEGTLLPPPKDCCQKCGMKHPKGCPHNADSIFYKYWFKKHHNRWPTWEDAISHCSEEVKKGTIELLESHKINWRNKK